jgi:hypothetical protein
LDAIKMINPQTLLTNCLPLHKLEQVLLAV